MISYIVLGNNAVTNGYIERRFRMPVQAWSALYAIDMFPGIRAKEIRALFPAAEHDQPRRDASRRTRLHRPGDIGFRRSREATVRYRLGQDIAGRNDRDLEETAGRVACPLSPAERQTFFALRAEDRGGSDLLKSEVMGT